MTQEKALKVVDIWIRADTFDAEMLRDIKATAKRRAEAGARPQNDNGEGMHWGCNGASSRRSIPILSALMFANKDSIFFNGPLLFPPLSIFGLNAAQSTPCRVRTE